ncbi:hypothetical protein JCM5296_001528 [Sporobolomyces johnsonii]
MDHKTAFRHITKRVPIEKDTLTYRLLARELAINVSEAKTLLAAYLADHVAAERGVSAVYLLSGYLKPTLSTSANGHANQGGEAMDVDSDAPSSSIPPKQDPEEEREVIKTRTVMLVPASELEAKSSLFSPPPTSHVYALTPVPLAASTLSLLTASSLSLVSSSPAAKKWKPTPTSADGYGTIVHPEGIKKRKAPPGAGIAKAAVSSTSASASDSAASTSRGGKKLDKGKAAAEQDKGKGKTKKEDTKKKPVAAPAMRPIGQLGGLFGKKFAAAKKASSSDEEEDSDDEDEEEEKEVKPRKKASVVPAKRKSTSPAVSKKPAPAPAPVKKPVPAAAAAKKKPVEVDLDLGDDDDDDDWAMDEEALMEAERQATKQAEAKKAPATVGGSGKKEAAGGGAGGNRVETTAERQKRELEEMMNDDDDDAMQVDEKPARPPPAASRASSSTGKPAASKPKSSSSSGGGKPQKSIGSFFKKG